MTKSRNSSNDRIRKRFFRSFVLTVSVIVLAPAFAVADGLVADGHANGAHTDLVLTMSQMVSLMRGQKEIVLTAAQKRCLEKLPNAGGVKKLFVFPSDTETCTCELSNVAVQVNPFMVEVPNFLLGRDLQHESAENEKKMREEEDKKYAEQHTHRGSKELELCKQANKVAYDDPASAATLYEQALKINPYLTDAKIQLGIARNNMAARQRKVIGRAK